MVGRTDSVLNRAVVSFGLWDVFTGSGIIHLNVEVVGNFIHHAPKFLVAVDIFEEKSGIVVLP